MSEIAIRAVDIGKQYRLGKRKVRYKTLRDSLMDATTAPMRAVKAFFDGTREIAHKETFWALRDVSFDVKKGDVLGIIGRNGAGKSTLLKVLARITEPTLGTAEVFGRVGSLLEVGTGFHLELTGRENIYLSGAILGMKRREIDAKFDEIVDFAEVEKFIDTPVKHFSSGMYLRLAFAVASHMENEILLIDEVLAVGDDAFQKKCLGKMQHVAGEGKTVLFVSHNMGVVAGLCNSGLLLQKGGVGFHGGIEECIKRYVSGLRNASSYEMTERPEQRAFVKYAKLIGPQAIPSGDKLTIEVGISSKERFKFSLDWRLRNEMGVPLAWGCPHIQTGQIETLVPGLNAFELEVGPLFLAEGTFTISLDIDIPWIEYVERIEDVLTFDVQGVTGRSQSHAMKASWNNGAVLFESKWSKTEPSYCPS